MLVSCCCFSLLLLLFVLLISGLVDKTFCCQAIYDMPTLTAAEKADMLASPFAVQSDSFYFVSGELIMHNKASYRYYDEPQEEESI